MDSIKTKVTPRPSAPPPSSNAPYDSITVNGKPAQIVNGQVQLAPGAKVEIKSHWDTGVFNQGPADFAFKGTGANAAATSAQLKKQWHVKEETAPVPPHQMGGRRYETVSFTAPKGNQGGLAVTMSQTGRDEQTLTFGPQAAPTQA